MPASKPYYDADSITIYCGDCLKLLPELEGQADLIATDPPYPFPGGLCDGWAPSKEFVDECLFAAKALALFGVPTKASIEVFTKALKAKTFRWWVPEQTVEQSFEFNRQVIVPIWFWHQPAMDHCRDPLDGLQGVVKPVSLMEKVLATCKGCVLDPFMGSGSTLIAARRLKLRAIGIEQDEALCKSAVERLSKCA